MGNINKFDQIKQKIININKQTVNLLENNEYFFEDIFVVVDGWAYPQLAFNQVVAWLYVLYKECSDDNIKFFKTQFKSSFDEILEKHDTLTIHHLRTYLQHNLNPQNQDNLRKINYCQDWFKEHLNQKIPSDLKQWDICLQKILTEALSFLTVIEREITNMLKDTEFGYIKKDEWLKRKNKLLKPHQFTETVRNVFDNLGLGYLDLQDQIRKHSETWNKLIANSSLNGTDDKFKNFLYSSIEAFYLTYIRSGNPTILPINGKDLINLGVNPGIQIGQMMLEAQDLYKKNPRHYSNKENLLEAINTNKKITSTNTD